VQYLFSWASGAPNSRAAPGSPHSSYATAVQLDFSRKLEMCEAVPFYFFFPKSIINIKLPFVLLRKVYRV